MKRKRYIKSIIIILIVVGFFYGVKFQFPHYRITNQSMSPSFQVGDIILTNNFIDKGEIQHSDVYVIEYNKEVHVVRIVGLPGDKVEVRDGVLFVNDIEEKNKNTSSSYKLILSNHTPLAENDLLLGLVPLNDFGEYKAVLTEEQVAELSKLDYVKSIKRIIHPKGYNYVFSENPIYPNVTKFNWSRDNFGPIKVPKKEDEIGVNKLILKNNYYFVLADNRHQSLDSRHWGFISEKDIKGKLISTLYSINEKD